MRACVRVHAGARVWARYGFRAVAAVPSASGSAAELGARMKGEPREVAVNIHDVYGPGCPSSRSATQVVSAVFVPRGLGEAVFVACRVVLRKRSRPLRGR